MIATCPTQHDLREYSLGQLAEQQSDLLFSHVADCPDCQTVLETLNASDTLVDQLQETVSADNNEFEQEPECQNALIRALAALAGVDREDHNGNEPIPERIGDYEILQMIGHGGMGTVYLARHTRLGRQVAVKVIAGHRAGDPTMRGRFETEMQAVGALTHPNIVSALDAREVDGVDVLVTEWIDGLDLGEIVRRTGPLSPADAAQIARHVAGALQAIDEAGLVHRDIKPSNIMITSNGQVKLLDLGLARLQDDALHREFTATGQAIGTADYLAPEQINGSMPVDIRADIYALGCTLFKLLTGDVPFAGARYPTSFSKMTAHVSADVPRIESNDVPDEIASLISQMMAKSPGDRPGSPDSVAARLEKFAGNSNLQSLISRSLVAQPDQFPTIAKAPEKPGEPFPLAWWQRRVPVFTAFAAGLLGIALGLLLGIIITIKHPDGTETRVEVPDGSSVKIDQRGDIQVDLTKNGDQVPRDPGAINNDGNQRPFGLDGNADASNQLHDNQLPRVSPGKGIRINPPEAESVRTSQNVPADPAMANTHVFPGVWELRIFRNGREMDEDPKYSPNLMVFGGVGEDSRVNVVIFHDNIPMAEGDYRWVADDQIGFHWKPPAGMPIPEGATFWLPDASTGMLQRSSNDRVQFLVLPQISDRLDQPEIIFDLSRIPLQGQMVDVAESAMDLDNLNRSEAILTCLELFTHGAQEGAVDPEDLDRLYSVRSQSKMRTLVIGMHSWHDIYNFLPASANNQWPKMPDSSGVIQADVSDEKLEFPYSWRVAILPFIGHQELYRQYQFDKPWDSRDNLKLLENMPDCLRSPGDPKDGKTRFVGIASPQTGMALDEAGRITLEEFKDGLSRTVVLIESTGRIPWTRPADHQFDADDPSKPDIDRLLFRNGKTNLVFADGSVRSIKLSDLDRARLRILATRSGQDNN